METKIVRKKLKKKKEPTRVKVKCSNKQFEYSQVIGLYFLILDYLSIFLFMFRVESINHILRFELEGFRIRRMYFEYYFAYAIPVLNVPGFLVSYLFIISSSKSFIEKVLVWSNARMLAFKNVLWALLVFILSFLFIGTLRQYFPYFPESIKDKAIPAYYLSYVIITLYFTARAFFRFDYYIALHSRGKEEDYRLLTIACLMLLLPILTSLMPYTIFI